MNTASPLDNFPLARTASCNEVREALARVYTEPTLRLGRRTKTLNARLNNCRLQTIQLAYGAFGGVVHFDFPEADCFVKLLPLRGGGEVISGRQSAVLIGAQTCATISPDVGFKASYSEDYAALVMRINAQALTKKLAAMTGTSINAPLRMELQPKASQRMLTLCRYLPILTAMLSESVSPLPAWWISQSEQLLMVMFLCGNQHNYGHLMEQEAPDCAPWQVRRAEDYIEANWQEAITLEDLAAVTGVSGFSLFRSFRKARGYSPFDYASEVRRRT